MTVFADPLCYNSLKIINKGRGRTPPRLKEMEITDVIFEKRDGILTVRLYCDVDHHRARRLREQIDREIFLMRPRLLVLDFFGVDHMDSSGIALILGRAECMDSVGGRVFLEGLNGTMRRLIKLSGVDRVHSITVSRPND